MYRNKTSSNLIKEEVKQELQILKESLRELGSKNDDGSIIGKLTLENVNLKVKIQQMESRYDFTRAELNRMKIEAQKLEHQLIQKMRNCVTRAKKLGPIY